MPGVMRLCWWCVCAVLSFEVGVGWSAPRYHAYDLGDGVPVALNNPGQGAGYILSPTGQQAAVFQRDQPPSALPGGAFARAINDASMVVGGFGIPWRWSASAGFQELPTFANSPPQNPTFGEAYGINAVETIIGFGNNGAGADAPLIWIGNQPSLLPTLGGVRGGAFGINAQGDIVGQAQPATSLDFHATFWPIEGGIIDLQPTPTGNSMARQINTQRQIVGTLVPSGWPQPFQWTSTTGTHPLSLWPGDQYGEAVGVNATGQVVGYSALQGEAPWQVTMHALLWEAGQVVNLQGQLEDSGWVLQIAQAINDAGWIVGQGVYQGNSRAFLLVPDWTVPSPPVTLVQRVTGDFNGDGVPDRAGIDPTTQIWVCLAGAPTCTTVQGWAVQIVAGDLDGNGIDDLGAVAADTSLYVRRNGWSWERVGGSLSQMVMGNFFGDGRQHLAGIAPDGSIWASAGLWPNGNELYGDWRHIPGSLIDVAAGDFADLGYDQLVGIGGGWTIWYGATLGQWTQLPGNLLTIETIPGTPDAIRGLGGDGRLWQADTLGAWYPLALN